MDLDIFLVEVQGVKNGSGVWTHFFVKEHGVLKEFGHSLGI